MTYTKQLMSAVALLASIAVLDNFIFIELEPGFESMVLVEPSDSQSKTQTGQTSDGPKYFWIDQDKVNSAQFAKFLDSTDYEPQSLASYALHAVTEQNGNSAFIAIGDKWRTQASDAILKEIATNDSTPLSPSLSDQKQLKVSFADALAYCNWLGKELPTEEQFNYLVGADQDQQALHHKVAAKHQWQVEERKTAVMAFDSPTRDHASYNFAEFRCVKNI